MSDNNFRRKKMQFKINPYIGEKYHISNIKILVVGESHYAQDLKQFENVEVLRNITINTVEKYLKNEWTIKYFERIETFLNKFASIHSFNEISFINFYEKVIQEGKTIDGTRDLGNSPLEFLNKLDYLKPDVIIVFSAKVYEQLPDSKTMKNITIQQNKKYISGEAIYDQWKRGGQKINHWDLFVNDKLVPVFKFNHLTGYPGYYDLLDNFENNSLEVKKKWNELFK